MQQQHDDRWGDKGGPDWRDRDNDFVNDGMGGGYRKAGVGSTVYNVFDAVQRQRRRGIKGVGY
jgi:hypothetical protein